MATITERLLLLIDAQDQGAARTFDQVETGARKAEKGLDDLGKKGKGLGDSLKAGVALGAGAIIGGGLADAILDLGKSYLTAAKGAEQFANMTNSTVKEAGQFLTFANNLGLELNDLSEIAAEFTQKAQAMKDELGDVGIELQKNADGSINLTSSLVDALEGLQDIPDDVERSRLAFQLFGEEGAKQLSAVYNGTKPVAEALDEIGFPIDESDVANAKKFNNAMTDLKNVGRDVAFSLASLVMPAISGTVAALSPFLDLLTKIPPELLLITGGLVAFQRLGIGQMFAGAMGSLGGFRDDVRETQRYAALAGQDLSTMGAAAQVAGGKAQALGSSLKQSLGGTVGLSLIAVTVGFEVLSAAVDSAKREVAEFVPRFVELKKAGGDAYEALKQTSKELDAQASVQERFGAQIEDKPWKLLISLSAAALTLGDSMFKGGDAVEAFNQQIAEQAKLLGPAAEDTTAMTLAQKDLNDLLAEGASVNGGEFAAAVERAAAAQSKQETNTKIAEEAIAREMGTYSEAAAQADLLAESRRHLADLVALGTTSGDEYSATLLDVALREASVSAATDVTADAVERLTRKQSERLGIERDLNGLTRDFAESQDTLTAAIQTSREAKDDEKTDVDETAAAYRGVAEAAAGAGDVAVSSAELAKQQYGPGSDLNANIDSSIAALVTMSQQPGITPEAQAELQTAISQLQTMKDEAGSIPPATIDVTTTGTEDAKSKIDDVARPGGQFRASELEVTAKKDKAKTDLDDVAKPRTAVVNVETRGGNETKRFLSDLVVPRTAVINVETRGGNATMSFLNDLAAPRTAIINVETRGGNATMTYLNNLANPPGGRTAVIGVNPSGRGGVSARAAAPTGLSTVNRAAPVGLGASGVGTTSDALVSGFSAVGVGGTTVGATGGGSRVYNVTVNVPPTVNTVEVGRATVDCIRAFERAAGSGWRRR